MLLCLQLGDGKNEEHAIYAAKETKRPVGNRAFWWQNE